MRRLVRTLLGALVAAFGLPAAASAQAVIDRDLAADPKRILYTAEAGATNTVGLSFIPGDPARVLFARSDGAIVAGPAGGCDASSCPWAAADGIAQLDLVGAELADSFTLTDLRQGLAVATPVVIEGGAGDDRVRGTDGPERFSGGAGDDRLDGLSALDDLTGGEGFDRLVLAAAAPGTTITLDDVADDGPAGSANVRSDVERLEGGDGDDAFSAGAGAQELAGGAGADALDPGPGADTVAGGPGADTIAVRDGEADHVDCGGDAADSVEADAVDVLVRCPAPPAPPPPAPTAPPPPTPVPATPAAVADDPPELVRATVRAGWKVRRRWTVITKLRVRGAPPGSRLELRCAGARGCPRDRRAVSLSGGGGANLARLLAGRRLRPGVVLELRISAPGAIGKVQRIVIRRRQAPRQVSLCLPPGAAKPARC